MDKKNDLWICMPWNHSLFWFGTKKLVVYNKASFGLSYSFLPSIWNDMYTAYSVVLAVVMTIALIWLLKTTEKKRLRVLAKKMLLADFIVIMCFMF